PRLDDLAYQMATEVNTRHQAGFDANGAQGLTFFNIPATSAGAAAMIAVNPTVAAVSKLDAASSPGAAGDNQTAQAIAGLRDARVLNGGTATPSDLWAELVYRVGADVSTARASHDSRQLVVDQLQRVRGRGSRDADEVPARLRSERTLLRHDLLGHGFLDEDGGLMRVTFDIVRDGLSSIQTAATSLSEAQLQVASGKRLRVPSDDPLGTRLAVGEHTSIGAIDSYTRSVDSAASRLAAADGTLTDIIDKLTSAIAATTGARGTTSDPASRLAAAATLGGLRDALARDINTRFD